MEKGYREKGDRGLEPSSQYENTTYYDLLGVAPDATREEIIRSYRSLSSRYRPQPGKKADPELVLVFETITAAFETLIDEESRSDYDSLIASERTVRGEPQEPETEIGFTDQPTELIQHSLATIINPNHEPHQQAEEVEVPQRVEPPPVAPKKEERRPSHILSAAADISSATSYRHNQSQVIKQEQNLWDESIYSVSEISQAEKSAKTRLTLMITLGILCGGGLGLGAYLLVRNML